MVAKKPRTRAKYGWRGIHENGAGVGFALAAGSILLQIRPDGNGHRKKQATADAQEEATGVVQPQPGVGGEGGEWHQPSPCGKQEVQTRRSDQQMAAALRGGSQQRCDRRHNRQ